MPKPEHFVCLPAVYAVGDTYQIIVPVNAPSVMRVTVGGEDYFDDSNGVLRSSVTAHRLTVPRRALDGAGAYTLRWRLVKERTSYRPKLADEESYTSRFRPASGEDICITHIADAHCALDEPSAAGRWFGDRLSALILDGDIHAESDSPESLLPISEIAARVTGGELPAVFVRGNHDLRGPYAERLCEHTPTDRGCSYFTFRLGSLWGLALDCGEDKDDSHEEYGGTVCCTAFRRRETEFIRSVIADAEHEYAAPDVTHRIVVCHSPFTQTYPDPFDPDRAIYDEWSALLREHVKPELLLSGHIHRLFFLPESGLGCPVAIASARRRDSSYFAAGQLEFTQGCIDVTYTDADGNTIEAHKINTGEINS